MFESSFSIVLDRKSRNLELKCLSQVLASLYTVHVKKLDSLNSCFLILLIFTYDKLHMIALMCQAIISFFYQVLKLINATHTRTNRPHVI